jgi:hypothetical protein
MFDPVSDYSFSTLRMSVRMYGRLPESVTAPLNRYSGGGRCEDDTIAFTVASCRLEEIFACCRAAGYDIPTEPGDFS